MKYIVRNQATLGRLGSFGEDEVRAAYNWLTGFVSDARGSWQEHAGWFRNNAANLPPDARNRVAAAIRAEVGALQQLETIYNTFQERARRYGFSLSGLSGLGVAPVIVATALTVVVAIAGAGTYYAVKAAEEKAARAQVEIENAKALALSNQNYAANRETPQQHIESIRAANSGNPAAADSNPAAPFDWKKYAVPGLLGAGALTLILVAARG